MPLEADEPYRINLIADNALAGAPVINTVVDPYRSEVVQLRDPRTYKLGDTLMAWQRTVHDGRAWGPIWAFLVFFINRCSGATCVYPSEPSRSM